MKHCFNIILFILIACCLLRNPIYAQASEVNDDPGTGRLSGSNIPNEWYEGTDTPSLARYGAGESESFTTISPYTNKTYTHQGIFSNRRLQHGVDVSQWQRTIDWNKVKAAGIDFAFIRVGYRGYGQSGTLQYPYTDANGNYKYGTEDPYYHPNMKGALDAGLNVGIYIFSQAITVKEAQEEAEYILKHIGNYKVTMPLIMDYEYASDSSTGGRIKTANLSKDEATKVCMAFCKTIADAGYTPMVYANKNMLNNQLNASTISEKYPIWLANYTTNTTYDGTFQFWQYASDGKVDGIEGRTDMNFFYGDVISAKAVADQVYTGEAVKPNITVTCGDAVLKKGTDYTLSFKNNKEVGVATATITGKNTYVGTKTISFKILPNQVTGFKAKKHNTKSLTLTWDRIPSGGGYQLYRSTALNGTYEKIATLKNTTTSFEDINLKPGQCYYYKIRSYNKINGIGYIGSFTPKRAICTKINYIRNGIINEDLTLHSQSSTGSSVVTTLKKNQTVSVRYYTKDEQGKGWYKVTYQTKTASFTGFVRANKITITKVGVITTSDVNFRKSYTTQSKIFFTLKKGTTVTVLGTKKVNGIIWYNIVAKKNKKKYTGWVSSPYVKIQ
ncbi:MAG: GH25 family lysozyme [Eubacteriales bacterium]|nr:GH25 family lysozyme [Eubacteriales bacterium]